MKEPSSGQADKPKPKSVVVASSSGTTPRLKSSATNQAKSGMILVSASSPLVDTVPPPLDERNTPMWLPMEDETLTVQEIELDGKAYQVLKNTTSKESEPELLPDKEQLDRNQSMEVLLARLNSQLLESSQDAINAKRRRSKDKAPPVAQGKAAPFGFHGSRTQHSNKIPTRATEPKSKSQSQSGKPVGNNSKSDKSVAQQKKDNQKFSTATFNSGSNKTKSAKSNPSKQ